MPILCGRKSAVVDFSGKRGFYRFLRHNSAFAVADGLNDMPFLKQRVHIFDGQSYFIIKFFSYPLIYEGIFLALVVTFNPPS